MNAEGNIFSQYVMKKYVVKAFASMTVYVMQSVIDLKEWKLCLYG